MISSLMWGNVIIFTSIEENIETFFKKHLTIKGQKIDEENYLMF